MSLYTKCIACLLFIAIMGCSDTFIAHTYKAGSIEIEVIEPTFCDEAREIKLKITGLKNGPVRLSLGIKECQADFDPDILAPVETTDWLAICEIRNSEFQRVLWLIDKESNAVKVEPELESEILEIISKELAE